MGVLRLLLRSELRARRHDAAVPEPVTPVIGSLALAIAVLVLVNLLGVVPGWQASRRAPAETLRVE